MGKKIKLTTLKFSAGRRVYHIHQGGGVGMKDAFGRRQYLEGVTWCGVERRGAVLVPVERAGVGGNICRTCLRALRAHEGRYGR